jgi:hypothetical protein
MNLSDVAAGRERPKSELGTMVPNVEPRPIDGEVLEPEPTPRIRVEVVTHRYQPRRHSAPPIWAVALLAFGVFAWLSPFALIVGLVLLSVFLTEHPTIAIAIGVIIAALVIIAIRERRAGRPF